MLSLGTQHDTLRLRPDGAETWQVMQLRRDVAPVVLGETLPLAYAQGLAEDFARWQRVVSLVDAAAPWRQQPASEKQTALMHKLGVAYKAGHDQGRDHRSVGGGTWGLGVSDRGGGGILRQRRLSRSPDIVAGSP